MKATKYYIVRVKCGHVGRGKYCVKYITIKALNRKEAAEKARYTPRVKHDWKDAIEAVKEVTKEEWEEQRRKNDADPFFTCKNIQDQRLTNLDMEICLREQPKYSVHPKEERRNRIEYKIKKREERYRSKNIEF